MRILLLCKRRYTAKDLIDDRFGRLAEIPRDLETFSSPNYTRVQFAPIVNPMLTDLIYALPELGPWFEIYRRERKPCVSVS